MSLFASPLSFSSLQVISFSRVPLPSHATFFLPSFFFFFALPLCSLSRSLFFTSSPSFCPCLSNAITCGCYRGEHNYRSAQKMWNERNLQLGNLNQPFRSLTVTSITIFHIIHGWRNKRRVGGGRATLGYERNLRLQKYLLLWKVNLPLLLLGLQRIITKRLYTRYVKELSATELL